MIMEKSAQAGEGGVHAHPLSLISTITYKVVVYTLQLRGQIHSPYFFSTPLLLPNSSLDTEISPKVNMSKAAF
jgi:hypothetical protein